jgi:capsular polysaccharide biosynthesis protein
LTFKDLIRLLRRRWMTALLVSATVLIGYMAFAVVTERPQYRARTRIMLNPPPVLLTAAQGSQWISMSQLDPKTWLTLATSSRMQNLSLAALKAKNPPYDVRPEWFANVSATLDTDAQLAGSRPSGPIRRPAADIVNTVAEQLEQYSKEIAEPIS